MSAQFTAWSYTFFASVVQALYFDKEIPVPFYAPTGAFVTLVTLQCPSTASADALADNIQLPKSTRQCDVKLVAGSFVQIVNLTACGTSLPHLHPGVTEINYVLEGRISAISASNAKLKALPAAQVNRDL